MKADFPRLIGISSKFLPASFPSSWRATRQ